MSKKHKYKVIPDIGLKVHDTFIKEFQAFDKTWRFNVRSKSEANIAKSCLTYYKEMWVENKFRPIDREDVIIDIGAHVGFFAIPISSQCKRVIAFEPSPANYMLLKKNIWENSISSKRIFPYHAAIEEVDGFVTLNLGVQGTTGHSVTFNKRGGVSTTVACRTIGNVIDRYSPTILKLDCEGGEWEILSHAKSFGGIRAIIAELHKVKRYDLEPIVSNLEKYKFQVELKHNSWFSKLTAWKGDS